MRATREAVMHLDASNTCACSDVGLASPRPLSLVEWAKRSRLIAEQGSLQVSAGMTYVYTTDNYIYI